jgi:26S proteasome regulatory subunit T3
MATVVAPAAAAHAVILGEVPQMGSGAESASSRGGGHALYLKWKQLQQKLEFIHVQTDCVKDEMKHLKREFVRGQEEVKRIQSVPLMIGQFIEMVDDHHAIVSSTSSSTYYVRVLSTIDREQLKTNSSIALHKYSHSLVETLPAESDSSIQMMQVTEKPDVTYEDIGGMDVQKQEVREAVELPLSHFDLYKQIGIDPPRGVLMYGPPGTGKTMLAKAVANATTAKFISVVRTSTLLPWRWLAGGVVAGQACVFMSE